MAVWPIGAFPAPENPPKGWSGTPTFHHSFLHSQCGGNSVLFSKRKGGRERGANQRGDIFENFNWRDIGGTAPPLRPLPPHLTHGGAEA